VLIGWLPRRRDEVRDEGNEAGAEAALRQEGHLELLNAYYLVLLGLLIQ
jgi:hypothetical protein